MNQSSENTFWGHVDVLRWMFVRCVIVVSVVAIALFVCKTFVFDSIILAPCTDDFYTYQLLCRLAERLHWEGLCPHVGNIEMININLSAQLFTHISISFFGALILTFPYLIAEVWHFVAPALYPSEKRMALRGVAAFFLLFYLGMALAYYIIFPLTLNFLGTYQVSESVANQISLNSYISTFLTLTFMLGIVFEMPIVAYFFASIGLLTSAFLRTYRKVAFVVVLVLAAFITPSTDIFTMLLVALPLYMLYEISLLVVRRVERAL